MKDQCNEGWRNERNKKITDKLMKEGKKYLKKE